MEKKDQRIQNNILFLGNRDDVYRLYQAMDVFVLPSRYVGLPVVGVEAQAAGLPCVLSDQMTAETEVTERVVFLSLSQTAQEWSDVIVKNAINAVHDNTELLTNCGFNILLEAGKLESFYLGEIQ